MIELIVAILALAGIGTTVAGLVASAPQTEIVAPGTFDAKVRKHICDKCGRTLEASEAFLLGRHGRVTSLICNDPVCMVAYEATREPAAAAS